MAEIDSGALSFKSVMDNSQMDSAIEETLRRVQGLSDGTVASGNKIDTAFNAAALTVKDALAQVGQACEMHEKELVKLESEYKRLGQNASDAFMAGRDEEYVAISKQQAAVKGEITVREQLLSELREQSDTLEATAVAQEKEAQSIEKTKAAQERLRTTIMNLKDEMASLVSLDTGKITDPQKYRELEERLGHLVDLQGDINAQGKILSHDNAGLQGVISAVNGVAGAMSIGTGVMQLFGDENEDLQKAMVKVQSVMAISMGMQQLMNTLNKDSAANLTLLGGVKRWWAGVVGRATATETASTVATVANTTAINANSNGYVKNARAVRTTSSAQVKGVATTTAATVANRGLAGSFKLIGTAIKSIPVIGWIIAGVGALVGVIAKLTSRSREAARATKQLNEEMMQNTAKAAAQNVSSVLSLSEAYAKLGDNLDAKKAFIENNRKALEDLGVAVNSVADAERLLVAGTDAFITAEMQKAQAVAARQLAESKAENLIKQKMKLQTAEDKETKLKATYGGKETEQVTSMRGDYSATVKTSYGYAKEEADELRASVAELEGEIRNFYSVATDFDIKSEETLKDAGIDTSQVKKADKASSAAANDPFLAQLEERKRAYADYATMIASTDTAVQDAARADYAAMLSEGKTYLDYLYKMRDEVLAGKDGKTKTQNLKTVNLAIADETQSTTAKNPDAERLKTLINDYGKYYDERVKLREQFVSEMAMLQKAYDEATTDEDKQTASSAMDNRKKTFANDMGAPDYEQMLQDYASFEQKKEAIKKDYEEKRKVAEEHGDTEMITQLDINEGNDLSALASEELQSSEIWSQLFGNLDEMTATQIQVLIDQIEAKFKTLSVDFNPVDLKAIRARLNEAKAVVVQDNPFAQLGKAFSAMFGDLKGESGDAARSTKGDWTNLAKATKGSFDFVNDAVGSCDFLKDAIGDVGTTAITSLETLATVSISVAAAIKTTEKASVILVIIQAALMVIQAVMNVVKSIIAQNDKKLDESIAAHAEKVKQLQKDYEELERAIDSALGTERYTTAKDAIENQKKQMSELAKMADEERQKKESDEEKAQEYEEQIEELRNAIEDQVNSMREALLTTDIASAAADLGNAFIDAFAEGEDAAAAWGDKVDDIVGNIIKNMLIQKLIEPQLEKIMNKYASQWYNSNGDFAGYDAVINSAGAMGEELVGVGEGFAAAMAALPDEIKAYFTGDSADTSLTGAVKGVTEETASMIGGQMNAIRINQLEATDILREHLMYTVRIADNTAYNYHLTKLTRVVSLLESIQNNNSLRSQGLS